MSESLQTWLIPVYFLIGLLALNALDRFWFRDVSRKYVEPSYLLRVLRRATGKRHLWLHIFATRNRIRKTLERVHPRSNEIAEHRAALELLKGQGSEGDDEVARLKEGILQIYDTQLEQDKLHRVAHVSSLKSALETVHASKKLGDEADLGAQDESLDRQING